MFRVDRSAILGPGHLVASVVLDLDLAIAIAIVLEAREGAAEGLPHHFSKRHRDGTGRHKPSVSQQQTTPRQGVKGEEGSGARAAVVNRLQRPLYHRLSGRRSEGGEGGGGGKGKGEEG